MALGLGVIFIGNYAEAVRGYKVLGSSSSGKLKPYLGTGNE